MQSTPFTFAVHPSSGVPIYRQIIDQVTALVASGRVSPGDPLPSIRNLAKSLEVNMMTVSKAYSRLEADGLLTRVRGKGMIVAAQARLPATSVKDRQRELRPLIDQAVVRGLQLKLNDRQITLVVESVLREQRKR